MMADTGKKNAPFGAFFYLNTDLIYAKNGVTIAITAS